MALTGSLVSLQGWSSSADVDPVIVEIDPSRVVLGPGVGEESGPELETLNTALLSVSEDLHRLDGGVPGPAQYDGHLLAGEGGGEERYQDEGREHSQQSVTSLMALEILTQMSTSILLFYSSYLENLSVTYQ